MIASLSQWTQLHYPPPETRRPEARVFLDGDAAAIAALQKALRREHLKGRSR